MSTESRLDLQLEYWNFAGPSKACAHPVNVNRLREWVAPSGRILDYGCGFGRVLGILKSNGYTNLIGMDPASAMIDAARSNFPEIDFSVMKDYRNVDLPDASVDAVVLFTVLTCVPADEGQRAIVAEITRVLRTGGILYISDMFLQTDGRNVQRYIEFQKKYGIYGIFDLREGATVRHHDRAWIEKLLAPFETLALDEISVSTMNGHPATAFQWFGRKKG